MFKKLLITTAISSALAVTPVAFAQQGGQGQGGQGGSQQWTQEQAQAQGAQIYLSPAAVRQIQQSLNGQGFDTGGIDGQWDQETSGAAQRYQRSMGLEPTGTPTLALINSLGMSNLLRGGQQQQAQGQQQQGQGQWLQEESQGPGVPIYIGTAGVRQIQQQLNQRGYDVGAVDGIWGSSTSQAAQRYQKANGLEPNGQLDVNLISSLGVGQQIFSAGQQGQQGQMRWTQENAVSQGTPLWASPATVRQVQSQLNTSGYDVGQVDGSWDEGTSQAVERFQKSNGLEPTGTLTTQLISALGMSNALGGGGGQQMGQQGGQQGQMGQQGGQMQAGQQGQMGQQGGQQGQMGQQGGQMQAGQQGQMGQQGGQQGQMGQQDGQQGQMAQQGGQQQGQQLTMQDFDRLDQNNDGELTEDELAQYGSPAAGGEQLVQRYDVDGDGAVSEQDLQQAQQQGQGQQGQQQQGQQQQGQQQQGQQQGGGQQ